MNKLGIRNYDVEYREQVGSWEANTQMKAPFILEKLKENDAVIWTDADSRFRQLPLFFDTITSDIGVFYMTQADAGGFVPPDHSIIKGVDRYLQSGTMFFKNNEKVIKLLERWIELNKQDPRQWDQWTLQVAILETNVTITELPPEYVWIEGSDSPVYKNCRPVIEHTQASRRFRDKIH
jgi:hypothetical protein